MYIKDSQITMTTKEVNMLLDAKYLFQLMHKHLEKMDKPYLKSIDIYDVEQTLEVINHVFNDCYIIPD